MKKTLALLICTMSTTAISANWVKVARGDTIIYYVDKDSINEVKLNDYSNFRSDNTFISAFVQPTYLKGNETRTKHGLYYSKEQWYISCGNKRYIVNGLVNYDIKDRVINTWQSKKTNYFADDWKIAYPDTVAEGVIDEVCRISYYTAVANAAAEQATN